MIHCGQAPLRAIRCRRLALTGRCTPFPTTSASTPQTTDHSLARDGSNPGHAVKTIDRFVAFVPALSRSRRKYRISGLSSLG